MSEPVRSAAPLQHLERLYAFAQVLTPDAEQAERLVEATYRRAVAVPPEERPTVDEKAWLFRLMLDEQASQAGPSDAEGLDAYRRSLAEVFLNRALPGAFAALPAPERLVLVLCEVEGFSCAQAGEVLGLDPAEACHQLETARSVLMNLLRTSATPAERLLLETSLPNDWLEPAFRRTVQSGLAPLPRTLRATLDAGTEPPAPAPAAPTSGPASESKRNNRRAAPKPQTSTVGQRLGRSAVAIALILAAGLLGYLFSSPPQRAPDTNVITLSARQTRAVTPTVRTDNPQRAERFVLNHLGQRLTLPSISKAALQGVGIEEVVPGVSVPAFVFADSLTDRTVTLYAYTYTLLQRYPDRLALEGDVLRQIEDAAHVDIHDLGEDKVLVWRHRDDIYVAVTQGDAEALRQRIFFPS